MVAGLLRVMTTPKTTRITAMPARSRSVVENDPPPLVELLLVVRLVVLLVVEEELDVELVVVLVTGGGAGGRGMTWRVVLPELPVLSASPP